MTDECPKCDTNERLKALLVLALSEIIAHHIKQNYIKGRPESDSYTLAVAREALALLKETSDVS